MAHRNDRSDRSAVYGIQPYMFEPKSDPEQDKLWKNCNAFHPLLLSASALGLLTAMFDYKATAENKLNLHRGRPGVQRLPGVQGWEPVEEPQRIFINVIFGGKYCNCNCDTLNKWWVYFFGWQKVWSWSGVEYKQWQLFSNLLTGLK